MFPPPCHDRNAQVEKKTHGPYRRARRPRCVPCEPGPFKLPRAATYMPGPGPGSSLQVPVGQWGACRLLGPGRYRLGRRWRQRWPCPKASYSIHLFGSSSQYVLKWLLDSSTWPLPPFHLTLAKPKVGSRNTAFAPSTLSNLESNWQMMWHGLKSGGFKPQALILPWVPRPEARM